LLGVWGWSQRDESRDAIVEAPETTLPTGPTAVFPNDPFQTYNTYEPADYGRVCATLQTAARLEVPPGYVAPPPTSGPTPGGDPAARAIMDALDIGLVANTPLDSPEVLRSIVELRDRIQAALPSGANWRSDLYVESESDQLATVLLSYCP
jgi:hypothetical protein